MTHAPLVLLLPCSISFPQILHCLLHLAPSAPGRRPAVIFVHEPARSSPSSPDLPNTNDSGAAVESDLYCRRLGYRCRRRRRPMLGAQASIFGTLAGDGHQTGVDTCIVPTNFSHCFFEKDWL